MNTQVAVVAGDSMAGEAGYGTLRYLLAVPAGRVRLLTVKYARRVQFDMTGIAGAPAPLTLADVRDEFPGWQLREGYFCWTATRRPTETAVEVLVGQDLGQLAAKLRAERDQDDHAGS
jgi:hypothetical protein